MPAPSTPAPAFLVKMTLAAVAGIAVLIYGWHLRDALLSDDFLYANWASEGLWTILRRTTIDSYPRMIRPLPGLLWRWSALPVLLHAISLALHIANAWLLSLVLRRAGRPPAVAFLIPILFVAFPLFGEPVIWLSASFDLWACLFALLALLVVAAEGAALWPAVLFVLALLCKESVLPLPALLPLLLPWDKARRATLATAAAAILYLSGRWFLFSGLGGYLDAQGRSLALGIHPADLAKAVLLQLPARLLVPLQGAERSAPWIGIGSAILLLGFALTSGLLRKPASLVRIAAAGLLAVLPVAPVLHLPFDLQGTRLLYFPVAMVLLALGLELSRPAPAFTGVLAAAWIGIACWNGRAWAMASDEVQRTLAVLAKSQAAWPSGAEVWVDAHDTRDGAYVFRNGLPEAARLYGLRRDLIWRRGTVAAEPGAPERLGRDRFEISVEESGVLTDWTACERALRDGRPPSPAGLAVRVSRGSCPGAAKGQLFWTTGPRPRFSTADSRVFALEKDGTALIRLPPDAGKGEPPQIRVDLVECAPTVEVVRLPEECSASLLP
jgi:hypothetical protein